MLTRLTGRGLGPLAGDFVLAGSLAVLSLAVIVSAIRMPRPEGWSEAPGLFPLICGLGLLGMAAVLALAAWRAPAIEKATKADSAQSDEAEPVDIGRTLLVGASVVLYALVLFPLMSYAIATFIYLFAVIWYFWRGKLLWIVVISLGATVFLSETFQRAFSVVLP